MQEAWGSKKTQNCNINSVIPLKYLFNKIDLQLEVIARQLEVIDRQLEVLSRFLGCSLSFLDSLEVVLEISHIRHERPEFLIEHLGLCRDMGCNFVLHAILGTCNRFSNVIYLALPILNLSRGVINEIKVGKLSQISLPVE